jgi:hypothetical protein
MNDVRDATDPAPERAPDVVGHPDTIRMRDEVEVLDTTQRGARAWLALCPYLRDVTGEWRAATPTTEHRCTAVAPPAPVTAETQRSLCLVAGHTECPLYRNARDAHDHVMPGRATHAAARPVPLTVPVILERPAGAALLAARLRESLPQVGLIVLIALAAAAVVLARVIAP